MDGAKIQAKVNKGYAIAARKVGTPYNVFRSADLMNPLDLGNKIYELPAWFATALGSSKFNKPTAPLWSVVIDPTNLLAGDWISNGAQTFYLADKQALLEFPGVGCNLAVDIERPGYVEAVGGGAEPGFTTIAQALPVFMISKKDKSTAPHWFPTATDSTVALPEWQVWINARTEGQIKAHDVLVDSQGLRYEVDTLSFGSFGYVATVKVMQP